MGVRIDECDAAATQQVQPAAGGEKYRREPTGGGSNRDAEHELPRELPCVTMPALCDIFSWDA